LVSRCNEEFGADHMSPSWARALACPPFLMVRSARLPIRQKVRKPCYPFFRGRTARPFHCMEKYPKRKPNVKGSCQKPLTQWRRLRGGRSLHQHCRSKTGGENPNKQRRDWLREIRPFRKKGVTEWRNKKSWRSAAGLGALKPTE